MQHEILSEATVLTGAMFASILDEMIGTRDQHKVSRFFGGQISQSSVSNYLRQPRKNLGKGKGKVVIRFWNAWIENGSEFGVSPQSGLDANDLVDDQTAKDDGTRPFVAEPMARDRTSGRMYPLSQVNPALVGQTSGKMLSDDETVARIASRFETMEGFVKMATEEDDLVRSIMIQAGPGIGKSFNILRILEEWKGGNNDRYFRFLSGGGVTPFVLYEALYKARDGGVVVLDDNDKFLDIAEAMNLLKTALDSSERRVLDWPKMNQKVYNAGAMLAKAEKTAKAELRAYKKATGKTEVDAEDENKGSVDFPRSVDEIYEELTAYRVPDEFEFNGSMIFITNLPMQEIAQSGSEKGDHLMAMMDRSWPVNLTVTTLRDRLLWCTHVFRTFMAPKIGLDDVQTDEVCAFITKNRNRFLSVSCRLFMDAGKLSARGMDWKTMLEHTKFKMA